MIQKGTISSIEGASDRNGDPTRARVLPSTADGAVTRPLTIPWYLRGEMGNLAPGTEVIYAVFEDGTGSIITRMDGEWSGTVLGDISVKKGKVDVLNGDVKAENISLKNHTHSESSGGTTTTPK
ncbi:MAG: pre-mRNA-splicing factor [Oscillospiraceae bacterium]|nr:pre-mRNA-splicing factor [Oscillospiraceae bacterium]